MKPIDIFKIKKENLKEKAKLLLDALEPINDLYALSLEELYNRYSSSIDNEIFSYQKDNNSEYIGGEFIVELRNENKFSLLSELFFKNKNGSFNKVSMKSEIFDISKLNKKSQNELLNAKTLRFDINL